MMQRQTSNKNNDYSCPCNMEQQLTIFYQQLQSSTTMIMVPIIVLILDFKKSMTIHTE